MLQTWILELLVLLIIGVSIVAYYVFAHNYDGFTNIIDDLYPAKKTIPNVQFVKNETDTDIQDTFSRCEAIYGVGNCKLA